MGFKIIKLDINMPIIITVNTKNIEYIRCMAKYIRLKEYRLQIKHIIRII